MLVVLFSVAVSLINAAVSDYELCFVALSYFTFVHVTVINIYGKMSVMLAKIGLTENMTSTVFCILPAGVLKVCQLHTFRKWDFIYFFSSCNLSQRQSPLALNFLVVSR